MSVHDAEPGDIYVDALGKLWRVIAICRDPTVTVEEVEGHVPSPVNYGGVVGQIGMASSSPQIVKARQSGGVGGLMWHGFKRIWRKEPAAKEDAA